jgi:hypothetical protein
LGLEVVNDIKRISEYIFNYLIYFHFVCYVPLTSERERERKWASNRIKMSQTPMLYLLPLF